MRGTAALFTGTGRPFVLREFEVPEPAAGEVVVRIRLSNVCGSDLHMWRGELHLERLDQPMPAVLGHEAVGEVAAMGAGIDGDAEGRPLAPGDRVTWRYFYPCGRCPSCLRGLTRACQQNHRFISQGRSADRPPHFVGPYATHHVLPVGQAIFRVPDDVRDEAAAAANCAVAAVVQGLHESRLGGAETVVVQGAGGLGLYACAVAKDMGAGRVVAVDGVPERLDLARAFGADATVDRTTWDDPRSLARAVKEATGGWGGDVVCEFVGRAEAVAEGIGMLAPGGRYLEMGCVRTGTSFDFDPAYLALLNRSVIGVVYYEPWALREALSFLERAGDRLPWERLLPARYPLVEIDRAFADAEARRVPRAAIAPG